MDIPILNGGNFGIDGSPPVDILHHYIHKLHVDSIKLFEGVVISTSVMLSKVQYPFYISNNRLGAERGSVIIFPPLIFSSDILKDWHTLPQKKHNFSKPIFIDREAGEIIHLVASVRPSVCLSGFENNYHMTTDLQSSPKEMQLSKSCVSFEEECMYKIQGSGTRLLPNLNTT